MASIKNISFSYHEFKSPEQLDTDISELISAAKKAAENAYAPYSRFSVGAAIRLTSGTIVPGTNVENAAFPSGICAERSAIANCISNYPGDKPVAIAIAAMNEDGFTSDPVPPCGNCRQVIAEEESRTANKIKVILSGENKTIVIESISSLLPIQFNKKNLKVNLP